MTTSLRRLGTTGPLVHPLALGCMGMSDLYGPADEAAGLATLHAALERAPMLLDTGDFYGMGHNELLVGKAVAGRRDRAVISVKFGALRGPDGSWIGVDGRPQAVKNFAAYTLRRLGVDHIDVYRPARLDPAVPIEDTVGAIADLVKAGYVRHLGLSEVGADTVRRAAAVHPIVDLQIEYSLVSRGPEAKILPALRELGVGVTAYGVLSRGLLTGSKPRGPQDFRAWLPRFTGDNAAANQGLADGVAAVAREVGATPGQLAIAWALSRGADILPLIGARTPAQFAESFAAAALLVEPAVFARLEDLCAGIAGTRYAAPHMAHLDSER